MKRILLACVLTAAIASMAKADEPYKYNELYYQRATLFAVLPVTSDDIIFLGNSTVHGCEWNELFDMPNIKNRGINGDVIQGIIDRLAPVVSGHPKKIFLITGANDVSHHLTVDSLATAYGKLINKIRTESPQTRLYVMSTLPINNSFQRYKNLIGKEDVIRGMNARLAVICKKEGATWIDLTPYFIDEKGDLRKELTNDGLHMFGEGYLIFRNVVRPYVLE